MKYPLDKENDFKSSLLFWLARFLKYKLNSLSNKDLQDSSELLKINVELNKSFDSVEELDILAKRARKLGIKGINVYFNPLKKLCKNLAYFDLTSLTQIDEELIAELLNSLTAGLSDASKINHRIAVLGFFRFISSKNEDNKSSHVFDIELKNWLGLGSKGGVKLPEFLNEQESKLFLKALDEMNFKKNTIRNKLLIKLIIYTGMRVSEVLGIKMADISLENDFYVIRIRGKGNKYRVVMVVTSLIEELLSKLYINYANKDSLLFVNKKGFMLSQAYVSRIVEQILFKAGIRKKKNGAHMLRHSYATLLYKKEKDLLLVQEALGHASLNTSRIYTHFDSDKLKVAAKIAASLENKS